MNDLTAYIVTVFFGFFALMNPIASTAFFAGLTAQLDKPEQIRVATKATLISFVVIGLFALLGKAIFHVFGITIPALRITGGILVFIIGYQMLHGQTSKLHKNGADEDADIAVSPLAVPLLAGPGTIATAINFSASGRWDEIAITILVFALLSLITFLCFVFGQRLIKIIGRSGMSIITRLLGMILAVIGTQMFIDGVYSVMQARPLT